MGFWIDVFLYCLLPVMVMFPLVALIQWLLDRVFGTESDEIGFHGRMQADFFQKSAFLAPRKGRESKASPHYDALVDEEWRASRLEDEAFEPEAEEERSLGDLLERKG